MMNLFITYSTVSVHFATLASFSSKEKHESVEHATRLITEQRLNGFAEPTQAAQTRNQQKYLIQFCLRDFSIGCRLAIIQLSNEKTQTDRLQPTLSRPGCQTCLRDANEWYSSIA